MASSLSRFRKRFLSSITTITKYRNLYVPARTNPVATEEFTPDPRFVRYSCPEPSEIDHSPFLRLPEVRISTLPNGIRVVTQAYPTSASHTACIGVWIDAGSRFEAPGTNGTAHFLEHMIFKGTRRRTARSLEEEIEDMGGRLNAFTSREQTTFFADVQSKDIAFAVDVLADILQHSKFPDHAIRRERGVILREMEEVQGQMEEVIFDHLHAAAFRGHSLGNTILGPEENIRTISRANLVEYIYTHYTGPRTVVSAAGAVKHDEIVDMVHKLFRGFPRSLKSANQLCQQNPAIFTGSEVRMDNEDMPMVHLAIAFEGAAWADPNSIPLMVIQSLLGSWNKGIGVGCSGSQLAHQVSQDDLAESVMAFNTNYGDTGLFGVYVTSMPDRLHDLSCVIMKELRRLAYQVSDEEIMRARNQLKSALLLHIDGSTAVSENNGRQMLTYGRVIPFVELFARIDAVDANTIKETAKNFVINKDIAIAAMGPLNQLQDHNWFCTHIRAE